jgi:hypothetical protein
MVDYQEPAPPAATAPSEEDTRYDDLEYNPALEPNKSKAWLNLLNESETAFEPWNTHCDNIDKQYANLERLSNMARDKEFQMFWANIEVIKPAIYARPPVPVVAPKFKDRRPIYQQASELMERCAVVSFDISQINELMLQIRDDTALLSRGVAWCRYESGTDNDYGFDSGERVCIDFKQRRDFLHSISRSWQEVTWVAAASYLTRKEAHDRFSPYSADCYQDADYKVDKDAKDIGGTDNRERAKFWEIWHKGERRVVWVSEGCEDLLDEDDPHLDLRNFFPCPKPAYGPCQRGSLVPVPDILQYKDQLDEVNLLTGRIHALSDALEVKGFYPSGGAELSDAIQAALRIKSGGRVLVPISNWAAFGGSKEVVIWLPIDMIAETITALVALRKQVIDDIYQIMGLSDIMRGATDARETLGAQELKTEYGSSRVRDKQQELVRVARDLVEISCDIMCEKFADKTLIEMSQTVLPSKQMQRQQVQQLQDQLQQQVAQLQQQPPPPQQGPPDPSQPPPPNPQAQLMQVVQDGQQQIEDAMRQPTIDDVLKFLHDHRSRLFVLDIETDSTIQANENAEKQRRTEFVGVLGSLLPQLAQLIAADPGSAELCGEILKFATAPFRAGRSLDGAIDDYVEQLKGKAQGPKGDDPTTATNKTALQIEQIKQQRQAQKDQADTALKQQELAMKDQHEKMKIQAQLQIEGLKYQQGQQSDAAKAQQTNQKTMAEREAHQADMVGKQFDLMANRQKMDMAAQQHQTRQNDMASRQRERQQAAAFRQQQPGPGFPT